MASFKRDMGSTKLIEEIGEVLKSAQNNLAAFKTAISNKHVVVFLGNTRSGKSTLVNYVMGTELISFEERRPIFKIRKMNEQSAGPVIGQGSQSCTTIPGIYPLNQYGMVIVDAPGFDDNRSDGQDIVNALYINQIKSAKTVKFVLVSDINELVIDNVKGFTDLIDKAHTLFPNFENLKNSISIIFTKDYRNYSQSDVASLLRKKIIDVDGLVINKRLIEHLAANSGLIGLFRMPTAAGGVTNEIDVNIEGARVKSCALLLNEAYFKAVLSSKSRLALLKIYQDYLDSAYFERELQGILSVYTDYFEINDYVFASTNDELNDTKQTLKHVLNLFKIELDKHMTNLSDIDNSLTKILPINMSQRFTKSFAVLVMIDGNSLMEDVIKNKFITKYKNSLKEILEKVQKLLSKIDEEIEDRRKSRQLFNASAAVTGAAGGTAVVGEVLHRVFAEGSRLAGPFGLIGIIGTIVTGVGAGLATTSLVVQQQDQNKRIRARERQGRGVYDNMFKDD